MAAGLPCRFCGRLRRGRAWQRGQAQGSCSRAEQDEGANQLGSGQGQGLRDEAANGRCTGAAPDMPSKIRYQGCRALKAPIFGFAGGASVAGQVEGEDIVAQAQGVDLAVPAGEIEAYGMDRKDGRCV